MSLRLAHLLWQSANSDPIDIGMVKPGEHIELTAGMNIQCTHHISDPEVQPGNLDILLVPGPDPRSTYEKSITDFLAAHAARPETDILSVCTGIFLCGEAGLLKGKKVCGPRGMQSELRAKFEGATWLGEELRWVQDGNFWSCGGVTNGNDLVSAYARAKAPFAGPLAEFGLVLTETGDRPQKYGTSQAVFTLGVVWQVVKAVFIGLGKR